MKNKKGEENRLFKIILLPVFVLAGILVFSSPTKATTNIYTDTVWTKAQSPIIVSDDILVLANLTIEPDVIVKFKGRKSIYVNKNFKAVGTANEPIIFTSIKDDAHGGDTNGDGSATKPAPGDWRSIETSFFTANMTLDHVEFLYGKYLSIDYGRFTMTNGSILNFEDEIIINYPEAVKINYSNIYNPDFCSTENPFTEEEMDEPYCGLILFRDWYYEGENYQIIDVTNNYWGHPEGPTTDGANIKGTTIRDKYAELMEMQELPAPPKFANYEPFLTKPWDPKEKKSNPVIIVPGILGSYLNKNEPGLPEVWPNIDNALLPGEDSYLYKLAMNEIGYPTSAAVTIPTDIFRQIITQDFMDGLIDELENQGYKENENLFVFPYDWRYFIDWSAGNSPFVLVKSLKEKVEEVKSKTGADKVDIIAHSMGGLVTKQYIKYYGQDSVGKFIDIATPHLGAPKAAKILMYGDDLGIKLGKFSLNQYTIKNITQNFPSVYQLLPSKNYFNETDDYLSYISDVFDYDGNGVKGNLSYGETTSFFKNAGRNGYLLDKAENFHDNIDNFNPSDYNVKTYNIIGCGQPTIGRTYILNKEKSGGWEYGLKYISGDGTVPLRSAEYLNSISTYYNTGVEHPYLPSANGIRQLVSSILAGKESAFNFSEYSNIRQDKNNCAVNFTKIEYHSPIELHVYDENGNHMGPDANGDIEMGIAGAAYDIIEENKFAVLPKGHEYKITGQATDSGLFNARIEDVVAGVTVKTVYFNEMPLTGTATKAEMNITDNQTDYEIRIDRDGDNVFESEKAPDSILNEEESKDFVKPETVISAEGEIGNNGWFKSDVNIRLTAQDNEGGAGILKTEYSLNNGESWLNYSEPFSVPEEGETKILYSSTDRAGNREENKELVVKIDKNGPEIIIISPAENGEYLRSDILKIEYAAIDKLAGIAAGSEKIILDNEIISTTTIDLFNYSPGGHILKIIAEDSAGNKASLKTDFVIGANIDSSIYDVERNYQEEEIYNKQVKKYLIEELKEIKKRIEKFGRRQIKRENNFNRIIKKCEKVKGKEWCEEKLKPNFEKIVYKLDKTHERVIENRLQAIIKHLDAFFKKSWISEKGYKIIKDDIEWLINVLREGGEIV